MTVRQDIKQRYTKHIGNLSLPEQDTYIQLL